MIPYLSKAFQETGGLRTEDVSRISYQLWSAVNHCAKHNVMHRDIKPENIMFSNLKKDSELRLIDFGSGTCDGPPAVKSGDAEIDIVSRHRTFAGSAFYISPESKSLIVLILLSLHSNTHKTIRSSVSTKLHAKDRCVVCRGNSLRVGSGISC